MLADHGNDEAALLGGRGQLRNPPSPWECDIERLLDDDVAAGGERLLGERDVQTARRADDDQPDAARGERLGQRAEVFGRALALAVEIVGERVGGCRIDINERGQRKARDARDRADVVEGDNPAADDGDAQRLAHASSIPSSSVIAPEGSGRDAEGCRPGESAEGIREDQVRLERSEALVAVVAQRGQCLA